MSIKFINCSSKFSFSQLYRFSTSTCKSQERLIIKYIGLSRIDRCPIFDVVYISNNKFPLSNFNYGFTFSHIELISALEDHIYDSKPDSRKDKLYDLMCSTLEIDPNCYLDEEKYKSSIRNLKIDNLFNMSIDINE